MTRLEQIEADLTAYRSGWVQYDRDHVRALQAERRALLAEKCGCGELRDQQMRAARTRAIESLRQELEGTATD